MAKRKIDEPGTDETDMTATASTTGVDDGSRNKSIKNNGKGQVESGPESGSLSKSNSGSGSGKDSYAPIIVMVFLFIISIGLALLLVPLYIDMGLKADFEQLGGEESLLIPLFYIAMILIFTAVILFITRKRKGRFIKYGFLGIICISMAYVFWAVFNAVLYPIPVQEWSNEVEIEGGVSTILVADLLGDSEDEIIVGAGDGNILIYDNNLELLASTRLVHDNMPAGFPISDLAVVDFDNDNQKELVAISDYIIIFDIVQIDQEFNLQSVWSSRSVNTTKFYTSVETTKNNQIIVGSGIIKNGTIEIVTNNNNNSYQMKPILNLTFPVNTMTIGSTGNTDEILMIGTIDAIYSVDLKNVTDGLPNPNLFTANVGSIIGIQALNINQEGAAELVTWNENGTIYIFNIESGNLKWNRDVGDHIGGVILDNVFEDVDGYEMVVSVDGRVIIYYSYDKLLDEKYEFTKEAGKLDSMARGLGVGNLDGNDEQDIVAGYEDGFKHYQYIPYEFSDTPCYMGLVVAIILGIFLLYHPEWYVVDIIGVIVAAGVTALIGISIGLLPIIVLLIVLAIYDAISVYKTKHMVDLADRVMEFRLPILLVVPKKRGYSFLRQKGLKKQLEDGEEREAMFMGLGDIIIPGALVISAFHFLPETASWFGLGGNLLVAILTLVGILFGFSALMHYVLKGNPQAGLPLLNTGAILGFIISYIVIYQNLSFGITLPF